MAKTLNELELREAEARKRLTAIRQQIESAETKELLPVLRKEYEGKYFKYRNSYGSGRPDWWLYRRIVKVTGKNTCTFQSFQDDGGGRISFEVGKFGFLDGWQPCSKAEYNAAFRGVMRKIQRQK